MVDDPIRKELNALKSDIAQLRTDIAGLTSAIQDVAAEKLASAKKNAHQTTSDTWEDIENKLNDVLSQGQEKLSDVEDKISQHPTGSLLTAFGVGFIIAKLMDLGSRH